MKNFYLDPVSIATALAAVMAAATIGYLNLHNDEVQLPFLVLLVSSTVLGYIRPRHAWVWAVIISLGVPLSSLLALKIGVFYPCRPGHPYSCEPMSAPTALSTFVLAVPALLCAYLGVFLRQGTWRHAGEL